MAKFNIDTQLLLSRLTEMRKIMPEFSIKAIDNYVLFDYKGNSLTVTANGSNMELVTKLSCDGDEEAFCTSVPAEILAKTLALLKNKDTSFEYFYHKREEDGVEVETLHMKSGKGSSYKLNCETQNTFPHMKIGVATSKLRVDASFFKSAMNKAYTFIDNSENAALLDAGLQGICMEVIKGGQYIQVTASSRTSGCRIQFYGEEVVTHWDKILIPRLFGEIVLKTISDMDTVAVEHDGHTMSIPGSLFNIKCTLGESRFPDMDSIFGQREQCMSLTMDRENFVSAMRRLKLYNDSNKELFMDIRLNEIHMSASSELYGNEGEEKLFLETPREMEIGMNINGMINTLNRIEANNVDFFYYQPNIAFFVAPNYGDNGGESYNEQFILMPVKYNNRTTK